MGENVNMSSETEFSSPQLSLNDESRADSEPPLSTSFRKIFGGLAAAFVVVVAVASGATGILILAWFLRMAFSKDPVTKLIGICLIGLPVSFGGGDVAWLTFLVVGPLILLAGERSRPLGKFAVLVAVVVIGFHLAGHRIVGRPQVVVRSALKNPVQVQVVRYPGSLELANGAILRLEGLRISREHEAASQAELFGMLLRCKPDEFAVDIEDHGNGWIEILGEERIGGYCGASFTPGFLPREVPSHRRVELAGWLEGRSLGVDRTGEVKVTLIEPPSDSANDGSEKP